jgi:hypothetical protein
VQLDTSGEWERIAKRRASAPKVWSDFRTVRRLLRPYWNGPLTI